MTHPTRDNRQVIKSCSSILSTPRAAETQAGRWCIARHWMAVTDIKSTGALAVTVLPRALLISTELPGSRVCPCL